MRNERVIRLPIGAKNVVIKRCKTGCAEGVRRPRAQKDRPAKVAFNTPTLCITLRKAA